MTEEEILKAIYDTRLEYAMFTPKERLEKYVEYQKKLNNIKNELFKIKLEKREKELKKK